MSFAAKKVTNKIAPQTLIDSKVESVEDKLAFQELMDSIGKHLLGKCDFFKGIELKLIQTMMLPSKLSGASHADLQKTCSWITNAYGVRRTGSAGKRYVGAPDKEVPKDTTSDLSADLTKD